MNENERYLPADEKAARNLAEFFEHGPGLRWSTRSWTVARDRANRLVLRGGLGSLGVGRMWTDEADYMRDEPEWETAPEMECYDQIILNVYRSLRGGGLGHVKLWGYFGCVEWR